MANIENQIDQISTAFYGSQVRGAIVEGLESINEEVNSLNDNIVQVDGKTEKMSELVNSSTEEMKELVNEYQNVNTKAQNTFQQIDGIMAKAMNEPTINAGILKNCDLENGGIHGTITNQGTIEHGLISKANFEDCAIVGTLDNAGIINGGKLNGGTLNECKIEESVISSSTIEGGVLKSIGLSGDTNNYGDINGGKISNATLDTVNIVGDVNNFTNIKGGEYENPTLFGGNIINKGTINGGTYNNPTVTGDITIGKTLNINTNKADGTINLNTNVNTIYGISIGGQYGSLIIQNEQEQGVVQLCHSDDSVILNNLFTDASIFTLYPSKSNNSPSTLSVNNTILSGGTFNECGFNNGSLKNVSINNSTLTGPVNLNGIMNVSEIDGAIYYLDNNGDSCIEEAVDGSTWFIRNKYTGNNMIQSTPVSSGVDTVDIDANIVANRDITINSTGGLHFKSNLHENNYNIACGYEPNNNTFAIWDENNWNPLVEMSADNPNLINFNTNLKLNGEIQIDSNVQGGTYHQAQILNSELNACGLENPTLTGTTTNNGTINGGTYSNSTLSDTINLNGEIYAMKEQLIEHYSETHQQHVAPNVIGQCDISWWLLKGPLLTGQSINGSMGILTMSITLDNTYNWPNDNRETIDIPKLPASSARTITPSPYFQIGTSKGTLYLSGAGQTLEAGQTYTTKALMWQ